MNADKAQWLIRELLVNQLVEKFSDWRTRELVWVKALRSQKRRSAPAARSSFSHGSSSVGPAILATGCKKKPR